MCKFCTTYSSYLFLQLEKYLVLLVSMFLNLQKLVKDRQLATLLVKVTYIILISDEIIFFLVWFGIRFTLLHIMLTLSEMVTFKILYLNIYSRIAVINEYFLTNFVTSFNSIVISCFTLIHVQLGEHKRMRLYFKNFAEPYEAYRKVNFP